MDGVVQRMTCFEEGKFMVQKFTGFVLLLFELFDKECLKLKQVTGIDIQDGVKCGLITLHVRLIMDARTMDTFLKV